MSLIKCYWILQNARVTAYCYPTICRYRKKTCMMTQYLLRHKSSHQRCSINKVVPKNFTGVYMRWILFLIKFQAVRPATLSKRNPKVCIFLSILWNFKEHLQMAGCFLQNTGKFLNLRRWTHLKIRQWWGKIWINQILFSLILNILTLVRLGFLRVFFLVVVVVVVVVVVCLCVCWRGGQYDQPLFL